MDVEFKAVRTEELKAQGLSGLRLQGRMILHPDLRLELPCFFGSALRLDTKLDIGAFGLFNGGIIANCQIGRYVSFAAGVVIGAMEHPIEWGTSSSAAIDSRFMQWSDWYSRYSGRDVGVVTRAFSGRPRTIIGHDVWLGQNVFVKAGVTIGTGAVVGSGPVVTKDIPPYAIAVGVPARVLRYRFGDETIKRMLSSQWWDYALFDINYDSLVNPDAFLDELQSNVEKGLVKPFAPPPWTAQRLVEHFGADAN